MIQVHRTKRYWEANILKSLLVAEGINAEIKDGSILNGLMGDVGIDANYSEVCIPKNSDMTVLEKVMVAFHQNRKEQEETNTPSWICQNCGEENDGDFGMCWNCSTLKKV